MITRLYRNVLVTWIGLVGAVGCGPPKEAARVLVDFKQVANFHDYRTAPDSSGSHGAGDGMYIMYKITQIKNTGPAAMAFVFDTEKVSTLAPPPGQISNDTVYDSNILLQALNVATVTVDAGQTKSINRCFIKKAWTSDPQSLVSAQVPLLHQMSSDRPVTMTNVAPNDGVAAVGNALPQTLRSLCQNK